jgi:hypothetical protein
MELAFKTLENVPRTEFTFRQNFGYRFLSLLAAPVKAFRASWGGLAQDISLN